MSDRPCWSSVIGLFIINFSTLDLLVQDFLEYKLTAEEFAKLNELRPVRNMDD